MSRKITQTDWRRLANSPNFEDTYDDLYNEEIRRESKEKKREKDRHAHKEDGLFF